MKKTKTNDVPEELTKRIQRLFNRVWDTIAYDCLNMVAEEEGKPIGSVTIKRDEVIDICWDYIDTHGGDKEACELVRALPPAVADAVIREGFGYKLYGM